MLTAFMTDARRAATALARSEQLVGYKPCFACVDLSKRYPRMLVVVAAKFKKNRLLRAVAIPVPLEPGGHVLLRMPMTITSQMPVVVFRLNATPRLASLLKDPVKARKYLRLTKFRPMRFQLDRGIVLRWLIDNRVVFDNPSALPRVNLAYPGLVCMRPSLRLNRTTLNGIDVSHESEHTNDRSFSASVKIIDVRPPFKTVKSVMTEARELRWTAPTFVSSSGILMGTEVAPSVSLPYQHYLDEESVGIAHERRHPQQPIFDF